MPDGQAPLYPSIRAHVCVSTTAREAHQLGYDVVVAKDAVGDRSIPADGGKEAVSGEQVTQVSSFAMNSQWFHICLLTAALPVICLYLGLNADGHD